MWNQRLRSAQNKGGHPRPNSNDFISQMADDVLVKILSLMPIKDAVTTSSLSKRWRFVWCGLIRLNFDGTSTLYEMEKDEKLCLSERAKFVKQVCHVVKSYRHPMVQVFRIRFDLDESYFKDIDNWIQFAFDKKVEKLELNNFWILRDRAKNYDFQLPLSDRNMVHLSKLSLKKLYLNGVNVNEPTMNQLLKNSPLLEKLTIYRACLFTHIHVGGRDINLKHFKLVDCSGVESFSLYDFDLVSLTYVGQEVEFRFTELPKLKKLSIGTVSVGFENNVFGQISSITSYLHVLTLQIYGGKGILNVNAIPQLTNVKKLVLVIDAEEDDSLLEFTSITKACPSLETFVISLLWLSPMRRRRKVRHVAGHPHEHLKLVEIAGYYGRISDLELVVYVIENAVSLRKVVIDPICHAFSQENVNAEDFEKLQQAARSTARRQITPILPRGVELAIF